MRAVSTNPPRAEGRNGGERSFGEHQLCIDDIADVGGTRMLGGKCCGRWELVEKWPVRAKDVDEFIETLTNERESALKFLAKRGPK